MSVREFAARLGASVRTVSNWEAGGQHTRPRPVWQASLDTLLQQASDGERTRFQLLCAPQGSQPESPDATTVRLEPMKRRAVLTTGLVAAAVPALRLEDLHRVVAALEDARRSYDGSIADYLRERLAICAADDGDCGARANLPVVLGIIGVIDGAVRTVKPVLQRELLAIGARSAEFAGWLYRDIGIPDWADYWRDRAMEWAQAAGDTAMQGYILLKKSQSAWDNRDAVRMLTLAQAVQAGPWQLPAKVRAEAAQQEARGQAMLSAGLDVIEGKLDEARQLFEEDPASAELGPHYMAPLLGVQTAMCYAEAGAPSRALDLYDEHLSRQTFSRRDYGYFLSLKGRAYALAYAPDAAAAAGLEALAVAAATDSVRTLHELNRLVVELRPWVNRSSVADFSSAMRSL